MKGKVESCERLYSGEYRISLLTHEKPDLDGFKDKEVNISIKQYKEPRSLDANAYYWVLCSRLAETHRVSKPFMHNSLLRKYGQIAIYDNKAVYVVLPETEAVERKVDEDDKLHLKPTAQLKAGKDGKMYRTYMLIKGSSEYDTREMSVLIDGTVQDCYECGIETLPPEEIDRMKQQWGQKYERKNKTKTV